VSLPNPKVITAVNSVVTAAFSGILFNFFYYNRGSNCIITRVGNKQASLTGLLACLIINQASQQAERPNFGKPASRIRPCLLACLPA